MTAKIVSFPTPNDQMLQEMDRLIRAYLFELTGNPELTEQVGDRMSHFVANYANKTFEPCFNLPLPPDMPQQQIDHLMGAIDEGFQQNCREINEMISKIIFERMYFEVEYYEQLNSRPSSSLTQVKNRP